MKPHKPGQQPGSNGNQNPEPKKIQHRSFELYLNRGSVLGHDLDDWLRAARELRAPDEAAPVKLVLERTVILLALALLAIGGLWFPD